MLSDRFVDAARCEAAVVVPGRDADEPDPLVLFWLVSETTNARGDPMVTGDGAVDPLIEARSRPPSPGAPHALLALRRVSPSDR